VGCVTAGCGVVVLPATRYKFSRVYSRFRFTGLLNLKQNTFH
jgi:hypothetical protein